MTKSFENYTLLVGSHGRRGSIWRGPDHLLVVEGSGVLFALSESYRRIDYENIQALSVVRTQRYGWLLAAFSAPLLLMAMALSAMLAWDAGFNAMSVVFTVFGLPLLLIPFVLLVVHLARGRTVHCTLQTAVQNLRLRPVTREAKAQRVMAEIAEICREHQAGTVPPLEVSDPEATPPSWQTAPAGTRPIWNGSPAVIVAGVIVLLWGVVLAGELFVGGSGYLMLDGFLAVTATFAAIIALIFAMRNHSPTSLQAALWVSSALGLLSVFCFLGGMGYVGAMLDRQGGGSSSPTDAWMYLADLSLEETQASGWIIIGLGILIGLLGLAILPCGMQRRATPPAITPPEILK